MSKDEIKAIEEEYAKTETPVVSNNSAHRWTPDVPMVVPEINPEHFDVIEYQKKRLGTTRGFIAVKPNCSIQSYAPVLTAWKEFEPYEVVATTYQAISGAGKTFKDWPEMVTQHHSIHRWRRREERERAAETVGQDRGRCDRTGYRASHHLPVPACSGTERTYSSSIR